MKSTLRLIATAALIATGALLSGCAYTETLGECVIDPGTVEASVIVFPGDDPDDSEARLGTAANPTPPAVDRS